MKKVIIALVILVIIGLGTYYFVFKKDSGIASKNINNEYIPPVTTDKNTDTLSGNVDINSFAFNPATLTVKVGTKVTWTNNDSASHTITSDSGNLINSATLSTGQSFSFTFTKSGIFNYHCTIHPMMKGKIIVVN